MSEQLVEYIHEPKAFRLEEAPELIDYRNLSDVDNLNRHRENGVIPDWVKIDTRLNFVTATQEGAMPYVVSETEHEYHPTGENHEDGRERNSFYWLGQTAVQHALSGQRFYHHEAGRARGRVEVNEAELDERYSRPGFSRAVISPRMSAKDGSKKVAKEERLAGEDSVRTKKIITDKEGTIIGRKIQSVLVRDIPLSAWVDMLADENNIFGKSVIVDDPESALSVLETHPDLEVPDEKLPEGVVSVIETVLPYIQEQKARESLEYQLVRFRQDQEMMHEEAEQVADRWLDFAVELADSLDQERATFEIERFIIMLQSKWDKKSLAIIREHQIEGTAHFTMSRELASMLESAKEKLLWVPAAAVTGNDGVIKQLSKAEYAVIIQGDQDRKQAVAAGLSKAEVRRIEARNDRNVAEKDVKIGAGCPGETENTFETGTRIEVTAAQIENDGPAISNDAGEARITEGESADAFEKRVGGFSKGQCVVEGCPTKPGEVKVGGCGVCIDRCQKMFDAGNDPSRKTTRSVPKPAKTDYFSSTKKHTKPEKVMTSVKEKASPKIGKKALASVF